MNNIQLFLGVNQYQIEKDIEYIVKSLNVDALSFAKYDCQVDLVDDAIHDCMTLSFFDNKKVVIIENPMFLTSERDKLEHNLTLFNEYISNPNPDAIMIINASLLNIDKRKSVVKQLMAVSETKTYNHLNEEDSKQVIIQAMNKLNKKIGFEAMHELMTRTEGDTLKLYTELDKISFYLGTTDEVTREDIIRLVSEPLEQNIFNLTNHILEAQVDLAIKSYHKLKRQNEEPLVFSAILAKNFHIMYLIKQYKKQGIQDHELKSLIKIHPYQLKKLIAITQKTATQKIIQNIELLADYDIMVKTGRVDKHLGFELFILKQTK